MPKLEWKPLAELLPPQEPQPPRKPIQNIILWLLEVATLLNILLFVLYGLISGVLLLIELLGLAT